MATFQGTLQDATARMKGSGVLFVKVYDSAAAIALAADGGDAYADWVNVGSITGLNPKENMTATQLKGDNAEEDKYVSAQSVTVSLNQRESALEDVREVVRGSFDTKTTVAAEEVAGYAGQQYAANGTAAGIFYPFTKQNGDGTVPTAIAITQDAAGADTTLTLATDYTVMKSGSLWGVVFIAGGSYDPIKTQDFVYTYTPNASISIHSGGKTSLPYFMWKITNTDENEKLITIYGYKATIDQGFDIKYKKDDDADPVGENPLQFTSIIDTNISTLGKQLYHIYQERGF